MTAASLGAVFLGGGCGAAARYGLGAWAVASGRVALWGTLAANALACALLAYLAFAAARQGDGPTVRLLLVTGFCGGFSTFSTFALEAFALAHDGRTTAALAYVAASLTLGLGAFALAYALTANHPGG